MNIKTVGLCGRSGSGKGYVSSLFARRNIPSIDTDAVYRELVSTPGAASGECLSELRQEFGSGIIAKDGTLDRQALSCIVFAPGCEERLRTLNSITHKYILAKTLSYISVYAKMGKTAVLVDAPVLFESGFDSVCDITVFVSCPDEVGVQRICRRDGISEFEALRRLSAQIPDDTLRKMCTAEIVNDGRPDTDVQAQVDAIIERYDLKGE